MDGTERFINVLNKHFDSHVTGGHICWSEHAMRLGPGMDQVHTWSKQHCMLEAVLVAIFPIWYAVLCVQYCTWANDYQINVKINRCVRKQYQNSKLLKFRKFIYRLYIIIANDINHNYERQVDGLVQEWSVPSALVMEILQSCTIPSKSWLLLDLHSSWVSLGVCSWHSCVQILIHMILFFMSQNGFSLRSNRADSGFAPSQWETLLHSDAIPHWLGTNLESTL